MFKGVVRPPQTVAYTASGTFTVPDDWNDTDNSIEVIGGGGGGSSVSTGGGGGGGYAKIVNVAMVPRSVKNLSVGGGGAGGPPPTALPGVAGGNTWFRIDGGNTSPGSIAQGVVAIGGQPSDFGSLSVGGIGGPAASGIGTTLFNGGNGGGDPGSNSGYAGGGSAADPVPRGSGQDTGPSNTGGAGGQGGMELEAGGPPINQVAASVSSHEYGTGAGGGSGAGSSFGGGLRRWWLWWVPRWCWCAWPDHHQVDAAMTDSANRAANIVLLVLTIVALVLLLTRERGEAQPPVPVCVTDEDRVHIRAQVLTAVDEAFRDNMKHLFLSWIKDARDQPARASAGLQASIVAYQRARNDALKWSPTSC